MHVFELQLAVQTRLEVDLDLVFQIKDYILNKIKNLLGPLLLLNSS